MPTINLNEQQLAFVNHREGPAVLLAVPGSGKTTTMVCRTAALIKSGVSPNRILTMTFTKSAALDMSRRYQQLFGKTQDHENNDIKPRFSTIHSFSLQLIRFYCSKRKRPVPIVLSEAGIHTTRPTKTGILSQLYREINGSRIGDDVLEALSMQISLSKNTMTSPKKAAEATEKSIKGYQKIYERYEEMKKENRFIDFDDMLTVAHRILVMDDGILEDMRHLYDFIQVDEAQDSSMIQHKMVDLLAKPKNNIVLIGDEDQSIYVWRGANPSGLLGFSDRYPDAKIFLMETNYRSTKTIVSLANRFIQGNEERTLKSMHVPGSKSLSDAKSRKSSVHIHIVKNLYEQYHVIQELLTSNKSSIEDINTIGNDSNCSDLVQSSTSGNHSSAILYRNNRSVYGLADMLERNGTAFYLRDFKDTLFNHWITKDICSFLLLVADPSNRSAFLAVSNKLNAYLTREVIDKIITLPESSSIWRSIRKSGLLTNFQRNRVEEIERRFIRLSKLHTFDAINGLLDCVDYDKTIEFASRTGGVAPEVLYGILNILKTIAAKEKMIQVYVKRLDDLRCILEEAKNPKNRNSKLTLSTVHSAKGLEFDHVMIVDMIEGEFPANQPTEGKAFIEEERRLCYVAMTRARLKLDIIVPLSSAGENTMVSRFVREIQLLQGNVEKVK